MNSTTGRTSDSAQNTITVETKAVLDRISQALYKDDQAELLSRIPDAIQNIPTAQKTLGFILNYLLDSGSTSFPCGPEDDQGIITQSDSMEEAKAIELYFLGLARQLIYRGQFDYASTIAQSLAGRCRTAMQLACYSEHRAGRAFKAGLLAYQNKEDRLVLPFMERSQSSCRLTEIRKGTWEPLLSIIIPVLNAEKYLHRSVLSVLCQTCEDIEIIAIDDGCTDSSGRMLNNLANKSYGRMTVITNNATKGPGEARNQGLEIAKGRYIGFVDADDWVDREYFANLLKFSKGNVDIIFAQGFYAVTDGIASHRLRDETHLADPQSPLRRLCPSTAVWDKIYRRDFIRDQDIRFASLPACVDAQFTIVACYRARWIAAKTGISGYYRRASAGNPVANSEKENQYSDFVLTAFRHLQSASKDLNEPKTLKNCIELQKWISIKYAHDILPVSLRPSFEKDVRREASSSDMQHVLDLCSAYGSIELSNWIAGLGLGKRKDDRHKIRVIHTRLHALGFTDRPLGELAAIAITSKDHVARAMAARELALWHMRAKTDEGYRTALDWIYRAKASANDLGFLTKLSIVEMLCHYHLGNKDKGLATYESSVARAEGTPDLTLARANFEEEPEARMIWMNHVLAKYGIEPIALLPDRGQVPYDRLTTEKNLACVNDGPLVTVLIAAYEAATMLPTALRSLQEQTWKNLEVIVIDDYSPTLDTMRVAEDFAASDPRIKVVRMNENSGAYVARNHGLDMATGDYITLHDADDWSHPRKIETQVRFLMNNPEVMGCTSEQARCREDLTFAFLRSNQGFIIFNTSSFMWRRAEVRKQLGYWDTVRFGADAEFIARVKAVYGESSVVRIQTGPLSFQRQTDHTATADPVTGLDSLAYGVRREYKEAQEFHHKNNTSLKYKNDKAKRPFSVPSIMNEPITREKCQYYDVAIWIQLPMTRTEAKARRREIEELLEQGKTVALAPHTDSGFNRPVAPVVPELLRELINDGRVDLLVYGQRSNCRTMMNTSLAEGKNRSRLLPEIETVEV